MIIDDVYNGQQRKSLLQTDVMEPVQLRAQIRYCMIRLYSEDFAEHKKKALPSTRILSLLPSAQKVKREI